VPSSGVGANSFAPSVLPQAIWLSNEDCAVLTVPIDPRQKLWKLALDKAIQLPGDGWTQVFRNRRHARNVVPTLPPMCR
jgi:hypothetical protein